jgi:transcriptional regulator EpsA
MTNVTESLYPSQAMESCQMSMEVTSSKEGPGERRALSILQVIEAAVDVRRRYQFFVWMQGAFQTLLPHQLAVCGVYERSRKQVCLEVFNSVVVPNSVLNLLTDGQSPLMQHIVSAWIDNRCRPLALNVNNLTGRHIAAASEALLRAGLLELLVHGVSRPQRASEIETLFVFASPTVSVTSAQLACIELLLPHLHSTYLRVQSIERETGDPRPKTTASPTGYASASISDREEQVLGWVREGMSNQEIGVQLGISPLTVKNHVQKILRKLGASNRAQAVARAMSMNLLIRPSNEGSAADS